MCVGVGVGRVILWGDGVCCLFQGLQVDLLQEQGLLLADGIFLRIGAYGEAHAAKNGIPQCVVPER